MKLLREYQSMTRQEIWDEISLEYDDPFSKKYNAIVWALAIAVLQKIRFFKDDGVFRKFNAVTGVWEIISVDDLNAEILEAYRVGTGSVLFVHHLNYTVKVMKGYACAVIPPRSSDLVIHVKNGMLHVPDSGTPILKPFAPEYFSYKQLPVAYDAQATCPQFENDLLKAALNEESILCVQKYIGQCLYGSNLVQQILLLCGTAGGGKSTIVKVIQGLIGKDNCCELRTEHLAKQFETYNFIGKNLLYGADVALDFLSNNGARHVKSLVGGDDLSAEKKGGTVSSIEGKFNVIVTCNDFPYLNIQNDSGAWRRRLVPVNFHKCPTNKPIPNFDEKLLREEGSGILNFAIRGLQLLMADILKTGRIILPDSIQQRVDCIINEAESMKIFVMDCLSPADGVQVTQSEVMGAYYRYCTRRNFRPLKGRTLLSALRDCVGSIHHVAQCHNIERDGKDQVGWRNLAIYEPDRDRSILG